MAEPPRFFVDVPLNGSGEAVLDCRESHHAVSVLRLRKGDEVIVFDGRGKYAAGLIASLGREGVGVRFDAVRSEDRRPLHLTIATGIPKGKRWQMLIEKCTELGADRFVPTLSGRSVAKGEGDPERWRRWAVEAAKQCRCAVLPEIAEPVALDRALAMAAGDKALPLVADPEGGALRACRDAIREAGRVMVFIGPEGGFSSRDADLFTHEGVARVRLSPFILRIETAAAAACALIRDLQYQGE